MRNRINNIFNISALTFLILGTALLASCQKEGLASSAADTDTKESATLTYSLNKEVFFDIKSEGGEQQTAVGAEYGTASKINVLWYGVYHKKADGKFRYMPDMSAFVPVSSTDLAQGSIEIPVTLIKDQEYELVFVAQHRREVQQREGTGDDTYIYMYNVTSEAGSEQAIISRNTAAQITSGEELDLFVYHDQVGQVTSSISKSITLTRPVSQINIATSADAAQLPQTVNVSFTNVPASYDIRTKTYAAPAAVPLSFNNLAVPGDGFNGYNRLATLYVFGGNKINCTITSQTNSQTSSQTITTISTAPNFKTNIVGNIINTNMVADGLSQNTSGDYLIHNEAGLAYVLNNLFNEESELKDGGNFYLTADEYDMGTWKTQTGKTVASPIVPAGKILNFYGKSNGSKIHGIPALLGGEAPNDFTPGIEQGAIVTFSDINMCVDNELLVNNNNGTVVVSGYSDIKDVNDCAGSGMLTVDADAIHTIEWLKAALASGVKVITLTNDISSTETLTVDHPVTINIKEFNLNVTFNNENYITIQQINN